MEESIISKENCEKIVKKVYSIAEFCREMGWKPCGGNYKTFHKYVKEYNLDTSHFTGQKSNLKNKNNVGKSIDEFFSKEKIIKSKDIINKLVSNGIKDYKCEKCGISKWNGEEIRLQVHHKDGDHFNNEIDNIQLLCPNCHSQTDTFAGKKNKKGECTHKKYKHKYTCKKCGKALHRDTKSGLCIDCLRKVKSIENELL